MKKMGILFGVMALAACSGSEKINVLGVSCEKIATGEQGDILVRCPLNEDLRTLQQISPNAQFLSVAVPEDISDTETVYVDIVMNDCGEGTVGYRVLVQTPDSEGMYAVGLCDVPESK